VPSHTRILHDVQMQDTPMCMILQTWGEVFSVSLQNLWLSFSDFFFLKLIPAVIIFILGWIIASVIDNALREVFKAIKIDSLLERMGVTEAFKKADLHFSVGGLIGGIVKWFLIVVVLMTSLQIVGLTQVSDFLSTFVVGYLPNVIIAAFILAIAGYIAHAIGKLVGGSSRMAGSKHAAMIASLTRYAIWIFAAILAFDRLEILPGFSTIIFTGFIGMIAIAAGLAFGLGGRDAAARAIESIRSEMNGDK
jgi:hypothetical protein